MGATLSTVGSVVGIASGVNTLFGGSGDSGGGVASEQAAQTAQTAADMWNYYKANYQPLETNLIKQAQSAGSPDEFERARGAANADVTGAFNQARTQTQNRLQSFGINPGSPAYQSALSSTDLAEGSAKVGALTAADRNTRNLAYSKALDVVGLGRNIPAQSAASSANAANAANQASQTGFYQNQQNMRNVGYGLNTIGNAVQKWFGTPPVYGSSQNSIYNDPSLYSVYNGDPNFTFADGGKVSNDSVIDAEQTGPGQYDATGLKSTFMRHGLSDMHAAAVASRLHHKDAITPHMRHFAGGGGVGRQGNAMPDNSTMGIDVSNAGQLQGPGTETSDSIPATVDGQQPAALSTGEFVMSAPVSKMTGEEILDAINQAGLRKRAGLGPSHSNQISPDAGMQAYAMGGKVRHGIGA